MPSPSPSPIPSTPPVPVGKIDHPTDPTAVVLRIEVSGGFLAPGGQLLSAPAFTLYGNNIAIYRPSNDPSGAQYPPFMAATLNADQVDALLGFALDTGDLRDAKATYTRPVADAPTTVFTIDAGGVTKRVSVLGLGVTVGNAGPDAAAYKAFQKLAERLTSFDAQVASGGVVSSGTYQPALYRAILSQGAAAQSVQWPWPDLPLSDFSADANSGALLGVLTADQASKVTTVPSGGAADIGVLAPDGTAYTLQLRPLLPDERF